LRPDNFCGSFEAAFWARPSSFVEPTVVGGAVAAIANLENRMEREERGGGVVRRKVLSGNKNLERSFRDV
jgi:hypothetical protein